MKIKEQKLVKYIGYLFALIYLASAVYLLVSCITLDMLPTMYLVAIGMVLAIVLVILLIMHEKYATSIIAIALSLVLAVVCLVGASFVRATNVAIGDITTAEVETSVVSVYVMIDDPAETIEDVKDYTIGIVRRVEKESTDATIDTIEEKLGQKLDIVQEDNVFLLLDSLKEQKVQAILISDAYMGIAEELENYSWASTDLRKITEFTHTIDKELAEEVPVEIPETFAIYLSGIDTYGGVTARSRSDVNILAVVNTETKDILLLSTPRDSYVSFSATGGAKDKLTHAGIYGVEASMDALEQLYGINVDYYLRINFTGFIDVIDSLGGVDVYSEHEFTVEPVKTYHVGYNHLTGLEALAFARERYSFADGDYQRAANQMEVIRAIIEKAASPSLLSNYRSVMNAVSGSFETSMPQEQIAALVKMQLTDMAQWNVISYTTSGQSTYAETFSMPGQPLYVINLDEASVTEAKNLIQQVTGEVEVNSEEVSVEEVTAEE